MPTRPVWSPLLPHSTDAERSVLDALFLDPDRITDVLPVLQPTDFFDPVHRQVYEIMLRLHEERRPIDVVTVSQSVRDAGALQHLGTPFLMELANDVPTPSHAEHYARIIRDKALHRKLGDLGSHISNLAVEEKLSAEEAIERAEQSLLALSRQKRGTTPDHIADIGAESYERYVRLHEADDKEGLFGLRTGFPHLDQLLTGLPPGCLVIVAARPSIGKSSFALDIARHAAAHQAKNAAVFSLEMTKQEIMDRIVAGELGVEAWKLKKGSLSEADFQRLGTLFDELRRHPLYIDDDPDTTLSNLRSKARRQQLEHGLDLLVIDYLQLIEVTDRAAGENRTQQVSHISRNLKNLARELGCPVIALSQLSRSTEQRNPPVPILSDLRDSGGIEQDADIVLMLYREEVYNEDTDQPGVTDIYVRKNRHGPTGRVELFFDKSRMSFRDFLRTQ